MSAISALAVGTDSVPAKGTTTPVSYSPDVVGPGKVQWSDHLGDIYALNKITAMQWRFATSKSPLLKVSFTFTNPLDRPVTDAGSNTTHVVAGTITARVDFIIPTLATSAEKTEFYRAFIQTLLDTQFKDAVGSSLFPY